MRGAVDRQDGFTLIELLTVIIIIGILAAIAIPSFLAQRSRANLASMKSDLRNVAARAETFYTDNFTYDDFEVDPEFTTFERSPDVVLDLRPGNTTASDYCIEATHPRVTDAWRYSSAGSPTLAAGTCP